MLELDKSAKDKAKDYDRTTVFKDYHPAGFAHYKNGLEREKRFTNLSTRQAAF